MKTLKLISADAMSASERAAEVALILAAAVTRTYTDPQFATNQQQRDFQLGLSGHQRIHTTPYQPENL